MLQQRAIVISSDEPEYDIGCDKAVQLMVLSGLVQPREISVSSLTRCRYLVILPAGIAPTVLMASLPIAAWANGVTFRSWSPLLDGDYVNLEYKVIVNFVGIPPPMRREKEIIKVASTFGVYLGSIAQEDPSNLATWTAVIGMHDLALLPDRVLMIAGGVRAPVAIYPLTWTQAPIYQAQEQPCQSTTFNPTLPISPASPEDEEEPSLEDVIPMSRSDLEDLCRGRPLNSLPNGVRRFLTAKNRVDDNGDSGDELETTIHLGSPEGPDSAADNPVLMVTENPIPTATEEEEGEADNSNVESTHLQGAAIIQPQTIPVTPTFGIDPSLPSLTPCRESRTLITAETEGNSCPIRLTAQSSSKSVPILLRRSNNKASPQPKRKLGSTEPSSAQVVQRIKPTEEERIGAQQLFPELTQPSSAAVRPTAELQPDGFYKIHVDYNTCFDMATVCGVNSSAVLRTVEEDNVQRAATFVRNQAGPSTAPPEQ